MLAPASAVTTQRSPPGSVKRQLDVIDSPRFARLAGVARVADRVEHRAGRFDDDHVVVVGERTDRRGDDVVDLDERHDVPLERDAARRGGGGREPGTEERTDGERGARRDIANLAHARAPVVPRRHRAAR